MDTVELTEIWDRDTEVTMLDGMAVVGLRSDLDGERCVAGFAMDSDFKHSEQVQ